MDALHSSELEGLKQAWATLAEEFGILHQRVVLLEGARDRLTEDLSRLDRRVGRLELEKSRLFSILGALPVSAWPDMPAHAFARLWQELKGS